MNKSSTLYWSHLSMYEKCPQLFLWTKGWDQIDVGFGPGNPKPKPKRSAHHALMGSVIQSVVEKMYNDEWWRDPQNLTKNMMLMVEKDFQRLERRFYVDYDEARCDREDLLDVCRDGVAGFLQTMKKHKLLGPYARAEEKLVGWIDKWNPVGGIVDTIIRRDDTGITILDGKNTKYKMDGVSADQLFFYALCFRLAWGKLPDRLAFVWYRFPYGKPAEDKEGPILDEDGNQLIEEGIEFVDFTEEDIKGIAQRALDAKKGMFKEKFEATPSPKTCKFCDFQNICEARIEQKAQNSRGSRAKKVDALTDSGGFVDLDLD